MGCNMKDPFLPSTLALTLGIILLAGCAGFPPASQTPRLSSLQADDLVHEGQSAWPQDNWWQHYQDPQLNHLIKIGLADSPSLTLAAARLHQAQAQASSTAANAGASLSGTAQATRQLYSENSIYPAPLAGNYRTNGLLHLDASYELDFWGRNRQAIEAALGRQAASQADATAAANTLTAAITGLYYQWQVNQQRLELNRQMTDIRRALARLTRQRVQAGLDAGTDLHPLLADVASPEQTQVLLQTRSAQLQNQLHALLGSQQAMPVLAHTSLPLVTDITPARLSVDLLSHRADIAAARDRVQASLAEVESARAAFYPDISLSAFLGLNSLELSQVLHAGSHEQGITPAIHLPLFDAGRLKANLASQQAEVDIAAAQYDQALVTAVQEVNDAMLRLQDYQREQPALLRQYQALSAQQDSLQARRSAGLADQRDERRNQLALLAVRQQQLELQANGLQAQIDLFKALGGGYQAHNNN